MSRGSAATERVLFFYPHLKSGGIALNLSRQHITTDRFLVFVSSLLIRYGLVFFLQFQILEVFNSTRNVIKL